jgi:hypothetical protein
MLGRSEKWRGNCEKISEEEDNRGGLMKKV